jgi:hypothetical protein
MFDRLSSFWWAIAGSLLISTASAAPPVRFTQSSAVLDKYDFVEITLRAPATPGRNPFTETSVTAEFRREGAEPQSVSGFCDSADGTIFRVRFMPSRPGNYKYSVTYRNDPASETSTGSFEVKDARRRGVLRVDRDHPWHFIWEGTGEHYFWNGTTAFMLLGWRDEKVIRDSIDRFHQLGVNRIRVLLGGGRSSSFWGEPIIPSQDFHTYFNVWTAAQPDHLHDPGFDYTRFNVAHWQKFERMLRYARDRDMIISVILDWNDSPVHPQAESEDERRFFRYAATRLGAFSNITWDLGDDISGFRSLAWSHTMGALLVAADPSHHLASDHPIDNKHQDRTAEWFGFTSFQDWSRPQHNWMLRQREAQKKTGRIIPQVNEEYGYEDHYPKWAQNYPGGASADGMRRTAWEIYMAGCYQTNGETARRGTGYWPDTGGGWINGRGDASMVMLQGYAHIVTFFTSLAWWKTEPHDELVDHGAYCLAEPGKTYAVYLPRGGSVIVQLAAGRYKARWFNPRDGKSTSLSQVDGPRWTSPMTPDGGDWALMIEQ